MSNGEKTFIKVTNKDIYDSLQILHVKVEKLDGKVNNHKSLIYGAFAILSLVVTLIAAHIMQI
jgi:hypothetical protein